MNQRKINFEKIRNARDLGGLKMQEGRTIAPGKLLRSANLFEASKGAVLWHCTEGKDRCGLLAAFLLGALGVSREQILEDYLLTNEVNAPKAEAFYQKVLLAGRNEAEAEAVKNIFLAKESYLEAAFDVVYGQFGGMEQFLTEALGVPAESMEKFREKVLI